MKDIKICNQKLLTSGPKIRYHLSICVHPLSSIRLNVYRWWKIQHPSYSACLYSWKRRLIGSWLYSRDKYGDSVFRSAFMAHWIVAIRRTFLIWSLYALASVQCYPRYCKAQVLHPRFLPILFSVPVLLRSLVSRRLNLKVFRSVPCGRQMISPAYFGRDTFAWVVKQSCGNDYETKLGLAQCNPTIWSL